MTDLDKYLNMLKSPKASIRYDACEELRVASKSSPEVIHALEAATQDEDEDVAERASKALSAEVHLRMLRKMDRYSSISEIGPEIEPELEQAQMPNRLAVASLVISLLAIFSSIAGIAIVEILLMNPHPLIDNLITEPMLNSFWVEACGFFGLPLASVAVIFGFIARWQIKRRQIKKKIGDKKGAKAAKIGIILGIISVFLTGCWVVYVFIRIVAVAGL